MGCRAVIILQCMELFIPDCVMEVQLFPVGGGQIIFHEI